MFLVDEWHTFLSTPPSLSYIYIYKNRINILNKNDSLYENGAKDFLHSASLDRLDASKILCSCRKCRNMKFVPKDFIIEHNVVDGFLTSYNTWIFHGDISSSLMSFNQLDRGDEI